MLEDIGHLLSRLPRYPELYPDNEKLKQAIASIYASIFDFCFKAKHVFRAGKGKNGAIKKISNAVSLATAIRLLWKPFNVQFGAIKTEIANSVAIIETEADLAEKEMAQKERRLNDRRWSNTERVHRILAEYIDDESVAKVNAWLSPVNVRTNHNAATNLRHENSGCWFLEGDVFRTWLNHDNSFLWLNAIGMFKPHYKCFCGRG